MSLRQSVFRGMIAAGLAVTSFASAHAQTGGSWQGFYAGGEMGYGWSSGSLTESITNVPIGSTSTKASGLVGGIFGGYNLQMDRFVVGLEADFGLSSLSSSQMLLPAPVSFQQTIGWTGSLRPRVGFLVTPELLLYGTAGLAIANVKENYNISDIFPYSTSQIRLGWTGGAGAEYKIKENWNLRLEYRYSDYGSVTNVASQFVPFFVKSPATSNTLQVGVSYKF